MMGKNNIRRISLYFLGWVAVDMVELIYRTIIIYFMVLLVIRAMGKRELGQFSAFDFVVAIIIAEIAAIPLQSPEIPIWHSVVPLVVLVFLEIVFSMAALHWRKLRVFMDGKPQVIIENGRIYKEEMKKARYNLDELLAQLREKGYARPEDVEVAVLETSGKLSVIPKFRKRPVTPGDLGLSDNFEGLPTVLVMDGEVFKNQLEKNGHDIVWLEAKLKEMGLNPRKVFLATLERDGRIVVNSD